VRIEFKRDGSQICAYDADTFTDLQECYAGFGDTEELAKEDLQFQYDRDTVDKMTHIEMCSIWRFGKSGQKWTDNTNRISTYFSDRLFKHFGGFTPEISKQLGF